MDVFFVFSREVTGVMSMFFVVYIEREVFALHFTVQICARMGTPLCLHWFVSCWRVLSILSTERRLPSFQGPV